MNLIVHFFIFWKYRTWFYHTNKFTKKLGLISKTILKIAKENKITHSVFDNLQRVLIKMNVIISVTNNIMIENILSLKIIEKKPTLQSDKNKHVGVSLRGLIIELIQIIHNMLKISDHITFPTHIS